MPRAPIVEIKAHAVDKLDRILERLAPGGRYAGGMYTVKNPTRQDRSAGSFVVWTRGHLAGAFVEFANRDVEKGDVIDLVSYLLAGGIGFKDRDARGRAIEWIADAVGLARMAPPARAVALQAASARRLTDEEQEAALAHKRKRAHEMWFKAWTLDQGSIGYDYLRKRGIELATIANLEADLHFAPRLEYWMGAQRDGGGRKIAPGPFFPAIVAAMRGPLGDLWAVHCTYLAPDGSGKAPVSKPKLIWPEFTGAAIRLCKGDGLSPEEWSAAADALPGPCALTEGIEDGLTIALGERGALRTWAMGSLGNIANAPALPCVDAWMVHRQNDWHTRQAVEQFDRAMLALQATGRPVAEIAALGGGKDINDTLRGK